MTNQGDKAVNQKPEDDPANKSELEARQKLALDSQRHPAAKQQESGDLLGGAFQSMQKGLGDFLGTVQKGSGEIVRNMQKATDELVQQTEKTANDAVRNVQNAAGDGVNLALDNFTGQHSGDRMINAISPETAAGYMKGKSLQEDISSGRRDASRLTPQEKQDLDTFKRVRETIAQVPFYDQASMLRYVEKGLQEKAKAAPVTRDATLKRDSSGTAGNTAPNMRVNDNQGAQKKNLSVTGRSDAKLTKGQAFNLPEKGRQSSSSVKFEGAQPPAKSGAPIARDGKSQLDVRAPGIMRSDDKKSLAAQGRSAFDGNLQAKGTTPPGDLARRNQLSRDLHTDRNLTADGRAAKEFKSNRQETQAVLDRLRKESERAHEKIGAAAYQKLSSEGARQVLAAKRESGKQILPDKDLRQRDGFGSFAGHKQLKDQQLANGSDVKEQLRRRAQEQAGSGAVGDHKGARPINELHNLKAQRAEKGESKGGLPGNFPIGHGTADQKSMPYKAGEGRGASMAKADGVGGISSARFAGDVHSSGNEAHLGFDATVRTRDLELSSTKQIAVEFSSRIKEAMLSGTALRIAAERFPHGLRWQPGFADRSEQGISGARTAGGARNEGGTRINAGGRSDAGARGDGGARSDAGARGDGGARSDAGAQAGGRIVRPTAFVPGIMPGVTGDAGPVRGARDFKTFSCTVRVDNRYITGSEIALAAIIAAAGARKLGRREVSGLSPVGPMADAQSRVIRPGDRGASATMSPSMAGDRGHAQGAGSIGRGMEAVPSARAGDAQSTGAQTNNRAGREASSFSCLNGIVDKRFITGAEIALSVLLTATGTAKIRAELGHASRRPGSAEPRGESKAHGAFSASTAADKFVQADVRTESTFGQARSQKFEPTRQNSNDYKTEQTTQQWNLTGKIERSPGQAGGKWESDASGDSKFAGSSPDDTPSDAVRNDVPGKGATDDGDDREGKRESGAPHHQDSIAYHRFTPKRRTIVIGSNDTLVSIAESECDDANLGWLIADINASRIKETYIAGKRIVQVRSRQELELPLIEECEYFLQNKPKHARPEDLVTIVEETEIDRELLDSSLGIFVEPRPGARASGTRKGSLPQQAREDDSKWPTELELPPVFPLKARTALPSPSAGALAASQNYTFAMVSAHALMALRSVGRSAAALFHLSNILQKKRRIQRTLSQGGDRR
ncbi:MAG TPA: hypothetical protein V6D17_02195 [Candidatus Obscuribacterales bacterium]